MSSCANCGLPPNALSQDGLSIEVLAEKQYGDKRARKQTVWVCSSECAVQALGCAKYSTKTSGWPVTLDQWRPIARRQLKEK